jgi:hypothetical protein
MERGYIKLWRKTLDSGLLQHATAWQLFGYLLLNATSKPCRRVIMGSAVDLRPGDVITGRDKLAHALGISHRSVRTAFEVLKKLEIVTTKATNKYTIVSIINWDRYQTQQPTDRPAECLTSDQRPTSARPAPDHRTRIKNKEINNNIYSANESEVEPASGDAERTDISVEPVEPVKPEKDEPVLVGRKKKLTGKRVEAFNRFWAAFGDKRGKAQAIDAFAAIPSLTNATVDHIVYAAGKYADERTEILAKQGTPKMAQGWISDRRWEDVEYPPKQSGGRADHVINAPPVVRAVPTPITAPIEPTAEEMAKNRAETAALFAKIASMNLAPRPSIKRHQTAREG